MHILHVTFQSMRHLSYMVYASLPICNCGYVVAVAFSMSESMDCFMQMEPVEHRLRTGHTENGLGYMNRVHEKHECDIIRENNKMERQI